MIHDAMGNDMTPYSVGFFFTADMKKVALIRKVKPEWQKGKLNGVGGKVEDAESFRQAMKREFFEETGVYTQEEDWKLAIEQRGEGYILAVFHAISKSNVAHDFIKADEQVEWYNVIDLPKREDMIPNILWFVFLAFDKEVRIPLQVFT